MRKIVAYLTLFTVSLVAAEIQQEPHIMSSYAQPKYEFEYGVHDSLTHDFKKQWEVRDGDVVKGSYRLAQPDGRIRVVNYYADGENGFRAEVKFEGKADNPTPRQSAFNSVQVASTVNTHSSVSASDVASRWNGVPAPVHQGSYRNEHSTQNVDYTIIPASSQLSSGPGSPFVLGRSVGPATRLSPIVVGYDAREPHETQEKPKK